MSGAQAAIVRFMDLFALGAFVVSGLSLIVAWAGYRVAHHALEDSREAVKQGLWSATVEAVLRIVTLDPTGEPVGEKFANLRISFVSLVDGLKWKGLGEWLSTEHSLGAALARQVIETERQRPSTTEDEAFTVRKPFIDWAMIFSQNLRHLRDVGHDEQALEKLEQHAKELLNKAYQRNGWNLAELSGPNFKAFN